MAEYRTGEDTPTQEGLKVRVLLTVCIGIPKLKEQRARQKKIRTLYSDERKFNFPLFPHYKTDV